MWQPFVNPVIFRQYDGTSWTKMPSPSIDVGTLTSISSFPIGHNPGLFAVNSDGQVFLILNSKDPQDPGNQWIPCSMGMAAVSASSATIWGITSENLPLRLSNIEQMSMDGNPARVKARGRQGPNWDNQNPFDESFSTHLWIVNRAVALAFQESTYGPRFLIISRIQNFTPIYVRGFTIRIIYLSLQIHFFLMVSCSPLMPHISMIQGRR